MADKNPSKSTAQTRTLKNDIQLFSRLYIACQARDGDLKQFFAHENQTEPPSLSSQGKLRMGTKSDLLPCLEALGTNVPHDFSPEVSVKLLDGAAIVNMIKPTATQTFKDYAEKTFVPFIKSQLQDIQRLDIIWDQYLENSLKMQAREGRGIGCRRRVSDKTVIPKTGTTS